METSETKSFNAGAQGDTNTLAPQADADLGDSDIHGPRAHILS